MKFEHVMTTIIVALIVLVFGAFNANALTINGNKGGDPHEFANHALKLGERKELIKINGECLSACVLYVNQDAGTNVCVTPKAILGFHRSYGLTTANGNVLDTRAETRKYADSVDKIMYNGLPSKLKALAPLNKWPSVYKNGGNTKQMIRVGYDKLKDIFPTCK